MQRVAVERIFEAPVDRVFARYCDHAGWSDWAGAGRVRLVREGRDERDGVGAVRAFGPGIQEEVTVYEPPSHLRLETEFEKGNKGRREVWLTPEGSGTRLRLEQEYSLPGGLFGKLLNDVVVERQVKSDIEESFNRLRTLVESGRA